MKKREFYYPSADGRTQIHAVEWRPDGDPVCVLQLIHGMAEYADRYDPFARYLADRGILVTGNDHLGHGKSVGENHPYGYFCHENAPDVLIEDVHALRVRQQTGTGCGEQTAGEGQRAESRQTASAEWTEESRQTANAGQPEQDRPQLPYLMLGHSMGSFILRNYLCRYGEGLAGAVIMGTGMQPEKLLKISLRLVRILTALQGEKHKSGLVNALAFGAYNRRIFHPASTMDWLSRDSEEVAKYNADPLCGFTFTLNGFQTLFTLIDRLHDKRRLEEMPKQLPVRFIAGEMDPVGDYGRAVRQVYDSFLYVGMRDVSMKLYEDDRHELVNEADRETVWKELYEWIMKTVQAGGASERSESPERSGSGIEKEPDHQ